MQISLVLTHACNLACSYCYTGEKKRVSMSPEVAKLALDMAFEPPSARRPELVQLSFFGGEPMLEMTHLESIAREAHKRAQEGGQTLELQMTTNGTLLDDDRLARLNELGVFIALSIDGDRQSHNAGRGPSYASARAALDRLLANGQRFDVVYVVHTGNVDRLAAGVRELVDLGVRSITLNIDYGGEWDAASLAVLSAQYGVVAAIQLAWLRRGVSLRVDPLTGALYERLDSRSLSHGCSAGQREFAVAPSGRIYGCARSVGEDDGVGAIGHVGKARASTCESEETPAACKTCAVTQSCERHCACACREETGDPKRPGPVLCAHQHIIEGLAGRLAAALAVDAESELAS